MLFHLLVFAFETQAFSIIPRKKIAGHISLASVEKPASWGCWPHLKSSIHCHPTLCGIKTRSDFLLLVVNLVFPELFIECLSTSCQSSYCVCVALIDDLCLGSLMALFCCTCLPVWKPLLYFKTDSLKLILYSLKTTQRSVTRPHAGSYREQTVPNGEGLLSLEGTHMQPITSASIHSCPQGAHRMQWKITEGTACVCHVRWPQAAEDLSARLSQ